MKAVLRDRAHVCKHSPAEVRVGKKVVLGVIPKKAKERQGILARGGMQSSRKGDCVCVQSWLDTSPRLFPC